MSVARVSSFFYYLCKALIPFFASYEKLGCVTRPRRAEDQLAAVMSRFAQPKLSDQDQGLQRRRGPFRWIGEELVDDAFDNLPTPLEALSADALAGVERVLLRTDPGHDHKTFDPGFVSLGEEAAKAVAAAGVKLVGIDTPSIDHATDQDLGGHHALYEGGVAILENLDLSDVPEGDYELIALPLRIVGCDSSPVRAVLRELS